MRRGAQSGIDLRVYGQQEFSLMGPHASGIDALHQAGVLVNQPRFPQHVRRGVLQLQQNGQRLSLKTPQCLNDVSGIISIFYRKHIPVVLKALKSFSRFLPRR